MSPVDYARDVRVPLPTALRLLILALLAGLIVSASAFLGHTSIRWSEVFTWPPDAANVFWKLRAPRVALGALAGAGLAVCGVILQALFRNPLATEYTLGVASGASLGAATGILLRLQGDWLGIPRLSLLAFAGAMAALSFVALFARLRAGRDLTRLLLAGVCFAYMCSAGVLLVTFLAGRPVTNDIVVWMMGSLDVLRPRAVGEVAVVLLPVLLVAAYLHRALDLLAMSDELAASRGVAVGRTIWTCFVLVGLLTGVIVANCGPIGFVGLIVPHIARALIGLRALPLVLSSAIIGSAFLAACDGIARLPAYETPVGILTNIVGGLFFLYLLATRDVSFANLK